MYDKKLREKAKDAWCIYGSSYRYNINRAKELLTSKCRYLNQGLLTSCDGIGLLLCKDETELESYLNGNTDEAVSEDLRKTSDLSQKWEYGQLKAGICDESYIRKGSKKSTKKDPERTAMIEALLESMAAQAGNQTEYPP